MFNLWTLVVSNMFLVQIKVTKQQLTEVLYCSFALFVLLAFHVCFCFVACCRSASFFGRQKQEGSFPFGRAVKDFSRTWTPGSLLLSLCFLSHKMVVQSSPVPRFNLWSKRGLSDTWLPRPEENHRKPSSTPIFYRRPRTRTFQQITPDSFKRRNAPREG